MGRAVLLVSLELEEVLVALRPHPRHVRGADRRRARVRRDRGGDRRRDARRASARLSRDRSPERSPAARAGRADDDRRKAAAQAEGGRDHPARPHGDLRVLHGRARHPRVGREPFRRVRGDPRRRRHQLVLGSLRQHGRPRSLDVQPDPDPSARDDVRVHGTGRRLRLSLRPLQHRRPGPVHDGRRRRGLGRRVLGRRRCRAASTSSSASCSPAWRARSGPGSPGS